MNKRRYTLLYYLSLLFVYTTIWGQSIPTTHWVKKYGKTKTDAFYAVMENQEGELIAVGAISAKGKNKDLCFARINPSNGLPIEDFKYFGGKKNDAAYQVIQTLDGGYSIVGYSQNEKDKGRKALLLQLNTQNKEVNTAYLTIAKNSVFNDLVQTSNGDLYVLGSADKQACLVKYNSVGKKQWHHFFDKEIESEGLVLKLTPNEQLIVATHQFNGKIHTASIKCLTARDTTLRWEKYLPDVKITDLYVTKNGAISATGILYSPQKLKKEDLFLFNITEDDQQVDTLHVKIQDQGKDGAMGLMKSRDNHYYIAGYNSSFASNINLPRMWVYRMDATGKAVDQDYFIEGGKLSDIAHDIIELKDGSILVAGNSESPKSFSLSGREKGAFLIKLLPEAYEAPVITEIPEKEVLVEVNKPNPPLPPTITWLNNLSLSRKGTSYLVNRPIKMRLRAIKHSPENRQPLEKMDYAYAINDTIYHPITITQAKSKPVSTFSNRASEIDLDPISLSLKEGRNEIFIKVEGILVKQFVIEYKLSSPNLHLLSIGVPDSELKYTTKDARDFANAFRSIKPESSIYQSIIIDTLTTKDATREGKIRATIDDLSSKVVKDDVIMLFISAHGFINEQQQFLIAAAGYEKKDFDALYFKKDILEPLEQLDCKKIVFIDACHSGGGTKGIPNSQRTEALIKISEANNDFYIMSSSSAQQKSYENKDWENGAFTKALTEAFNNTLVKVAEGVSIRANTDDNYLNLAELYAFVKKRVTYLAKTKNKTQTPYMKKAFFELDLPIFEY